MPEGNTIHWLARRHTKDLAGRVVRASSPQGRFAKETARLDRRRFRGAEAYGKHLFHHWSGGRIVHVHLGMAGWFYRHVGAVPDPRPTVRMRLAVPELAIDLIGPPTCALITESERAEILARLGPDPLRRDANPARALERLRARRRPVGDALLDQRVLSGVGNIYRTEALFLTGIHPLRPTTSLTDAEWGRLWDVLRTLMRRGAARGTTRTVDPREQPHAPLHTRRRGGAATPEDDDAFYVYRRRFCRRCETPVRELPLSGRRMFFCPRCQRR